MSHPRLRNRCLWLAATLALLVTGAACRSVFRYPAEPYDSARPKEEILLEGMNPFLLTNLVSGRIVVEIDWIEGHEPDPVALELLQERLRTSGPPAKQIRIQLDDEIPLAIWESVPGDFRARSVQLGPHLDHDPGNWLEEELIYVVYVPGRPEFLGWTRTMTYERDDDLWVVPTIFMFPETIEHKAQLWVTARRIERAILVHEAGHVLGLVADPDHQERDNPRHCTEPPCVMAHMGTRAQLYNAFPALFGGKVPDDFGDKCRADMTRVKQIWAARAEEDPAFPDTLRKRRRVQELRAQACWYGERERWNEAAEKLRQARELLGEDQAEAASLNDTERYLRLFKNCPD